MISLRSTGALLASFFAISLSAMQDCDCTCQKLTKQIQAKQEPAKPAQQEELKGEAIVWKKLFGDSKLAQICSAQLKNEQDADNCRTIKNWLGSAFREMHLIETSKTHEDFKHKIEKAIVAMSLCHNFSEKEINEISEYVSYIEKKYSKLSRSDWGWGYCPQPHVYARKVCIQRTIAEGEELKKMLNCK